MPIFKIPAEPNADRMWLLDHPDHGGPLQASRMGNNAWDLHLSATSEERLSWAELLELGEVTDVDPDDTSWLNGMLAFPLRAAGREIYDRDNTFVQAVDGPWAHEHDPQFAALIARLVNEHVARRAAKMED